MSLAVDIATILANDAALNLTIGQNLFIGQLTNAPDNQVAVIDEGGDPPQLTLEKSMIYNKPRARIIVRDTSYLACWRLAAEIASTVRTKTRMAANGSEYHAFKCLTEPCFLGWDKNNRIMIYMVYQALKE